MALTGLYAIQHFTKDVDTTLLVLMNRARHHRARRTAQLSREVSDGYPFTMDLRLCDDDGMVSHEPVEDVRTPRTLDSSYLERLNRLRRMSRTFDAPEDVTEPFMCTGNAHLAREHIRCTSPAHQAMAGTWDQLNAEGRLIFPDGWPTGSKARSEP